MSFAHVVAYFSWPAIALGIFGIAILIRRKQRGDPPWPFTGILALTLVISSFVLLIAYGQATKANLLNEQALYALMGVWFLRLTPRIWRRATNASAQPNSSPTRKRSAAVFAAVLGASLILFSAYKVVGDYFFEPIELSGFVVGKYVTHNRYGLAYYHVKVGGHDFPVTEDVYEKIASPSHVKLAVGRATHTIFRASITPIAPRDIWGVPLSWTQH